MAEVFETRPHILIDVDELRRDFFVGAALKKVLEDRGAVVTLTNRSRLPWYFRFGHFDAVVLGNVLNIPLEQLRSVAEYTDIHMMSTEGAIPNEKGLERKYGYSVDPSQRDAKIATVARFHLWGDHSRRYLFSAGYFSNEQLCVSGAPRFDYHHGRCQETVSARNLPLGIVSRFVHLNPYLAPNHIEWVDCFRAERYRGSLYPAEGGIEDVYWLQIASMGVLLQLLDECQRRGQEVLVRPHPREDLGAYDYLVKKYPDVVSLQHHELSLESWLGKVCAVASFNSTSNYEIVASGKMGISLDSLLGERGLRHMGRSSTTCYPVTGSLIQPEKLEDVFAALDRLDGSGWNPEEQYAGIVDHVRDICDFPRDRPALLKVSDEISRTLEMSGRRVSHRWAQSLRNRACREVVRLVEFILFAIVRRPATSVYFPMWERRYMRRWKVYIDRYTEG
jgi:surface carbohydrate biosynthesis protein